MKELQARFAEVERRVRQLVDENGRLREKVRVLEQELAAAREASAELAQNRERHAQVRERLARVLKALETLETDEHEHADDRRIGSADSP